LASNAPRQQCKILKHEGQGIEAVGRRRAAQFRASLAWLQQADKDRQQRALAAAGGTDDRDHLARGHRERHLVEHVQRVEAVADMIGDQVHSITNSRQNSSLPATNARRLRKGAKRRSNPSFPVLRYGLLRCARNDDLARTIINPPSHIPWR
jgi:hypothetical protein